MKTLFLSTDKRKVVTLGDLSRETGIPIRTLRDHIVRGEIPGVFRTGKGRRWRIRRSDAERWWEQLNRQAV